MKEIAETSDYRPKLARSYSCDGCGAEGCKLWREYGTFANRTKLLCGSCALVNQNEQGPIDETGRRESDCGRTDQIGWLIPAVPDEEGHGFWGYTSVPEAGCRWWRTLPTVAAS